MEVGCFDQENNTNYTLLVKAGWVSVDRVREILLTQKMDCNMVGRCGFNLFHLYIVRSLLTEDGFSMLKWWADMPMVDCNTYCLIVNDRPKITMLHPLQLVVRVVSLYPQTKERSIKVISYLLSRGMSCNGGLLEEWMTDSVFMKERYAKQMAPRTQHKTGSTSSTTTTLLPTPQMNDLADIPHNQHIGFVSNNGMVFYFHASYMDAIFKTRLFPFTLEPIHDNMIHKWVSIFEKEWVPREEFVSAIPSVCDENMVDGMDVDKLFVYWLSDWITSVYPYSRMIQLTTFVLTEKMYEYMCIRLRGGVFHLHPFHKRRRAGMSWKQYFLWSCYDCIHEFFFANQMEELISQLSLYYSHSFSQYPDVGTFIFMNDHDTSPFKAYAHEYDYTMLQVYQLFKRMHAFIKKE